MRINYIRGRLDHIEYCSRRLYGSGTKMRHQIADEIRKEVSKLRNELLDPDQQVNPSRIENDSAVQQRDERDQGSS